MLDSYVLTEATVQEASRMNGDKHTTLCWPVVLSQNIKRSSGNLHDFLVFEKDQPEGSRKMLRCWGWRPAGGNKDVVNMSWAHPLILRGEIDWNFKTHFQPVMLRVVAGPDLLKERGITPPKPGK